MWSSFLSPTPLLSPGQERSEIPTLFSVSFSPRSAPKRESKISAPLSPSPSPLTRTTSWSVLFSFFMLMRKRNLYPSFISFFPPLLQREEEVAPHCFFLDPSTSFFFSAGPSLYFFRLALRRKARPPSVPSFWVNDARYGLTDVPFGVSLPPPDRIIRPLRPSFFLHHRRKADGAFPPSPECFSRDQKRRTPLFSSFFPPTDRHQPGETEDLSAYPPQFGFPPSPPFLFGGNYIA